MLTRIDPSLRGIGMTSQRTRDRLVQRLREQGISSPAVLEAIRYTPRHLFVDEALAHRAYEDTALPIGYGQTISQPYVVARMTELLLQLGTPTRVLEVGTGSGYQTALLAQLVGQVYTVERIAALLSLARERLGRLGLRNLRFRHSDGSWGWEAEAPFDHILVTAAPTELPKALLTQLAPGGSMIAPVGPARHQRLARITRVEDGFEQEELDPVSFVPLLQGAE